jgi:hypothetical protein
MHVDDDDDDDMQDMKTKPKMETTKHFPRLGNFSLPGPFNN